MFPFEIYMYVFLIVLYFATYLKLFASANICYYFKILHGILQNLTKSEELNFHSITLSDNGCIKRNIYNARRRKYPPLPQSIENVHTVLNSLNFKTIEYENFVLVNNR
jgi:hypothetical protein